MASASAVAALEGKKLALESSDVALNTEIGTLRQTLSDALQEISDNQQVHAASMNQVVDEAKNKFEALVTTANQQSADIQLVVNESRKEFCEIKQGCKDFGDKVEKYATEAAAEREGIKAVINHVVAGYGQELGAIKQKMVEMEQRMTGGNGGTGVVSSAARIATNDHRNGFKGYN